MSDNFKNDIIEISFIGGEQPSATKLTGTVTQLKTAISRLSKAIGDVFNEQTHTSSSGSFTLSDQPTVGPNINRLIGSAGWLNPRQQGRIRQTFEVILSGGSSNASLTADPHYRRKFFKLPYPAILLKRDGQYEDAELGEDVWLASSTNHYMYGPSYKDATWAVGAPGGDYTDGSTKATTRVSSLSRLDSSGEFYCDWKDGSVYLADGLYGDTGLGVYLTGTAPNMVISNGNANWPTEVSGMKITISGMSNAVNNGTFTITAVNSPTELQFTNASGVAEIGPFLSSRWTIEEAIKVTYQCDTLSDSYDGATFNVIPDFAQSSPLCTVSLISASTYELVTPAAQESRGRSGTYWSGSVTLDNSIYPEDHTWDLSGYTSVTPSDNPLYSYQIDLPKALTENLSSGDVIPDGYIQIWDETSQAILSGGVFTYINANTVRCSGLNLTAGSTKYRIIVPGTSITATLYHLRQSYFNHRHTGEFDSYDLTFDGHRISHTDLTHLFDEGDGGNYTKGFFPSSIGVTRNPHPQYLHRYGYQFGNSLTDTANKDNALLGHLVVSSLDGNLNLTYNSYGLYFGSYTAGPSLEYAVGSDTLLISRKDLDLDKGLIVSEDITVGDSLISDSSKCAEPRIQLNLPASIISYYINVLDGNPSNPGDCGPRLYCGTRDDGQFIVTTNAKYDGTSLSDNWVQDDGTSPSGKFIISSDKLKMYSYDASAPSGTTFTDLQWSDNTNGTLYFYTGFDWSGSGGSYCYLYNGRLIFSDAGGYTNPSSGAPVLSNTLYAKNIPKGWGNFSCDGAGAGATITVNDSFNIDSVSIVNRATSYYLFNVTMDREMADTNYCVQLSLETNYSLSATGWGYNLGVWQTNKTTTSFDIVLSDPTGSVLDCRDAAIEVNCIIFGEQS